MTDIDKFDFPTTVKRTGRRKTVAIRVRDGEVHVTAPQRLPETRIAALLVQKDAWIRKKLAEEAAKPEMRPREFVSGEFFPYLGKSYGLELTAGDRGQVSFDGSRLRLTVPEKLQGEPRKKYTRSRLENWYRDKAAGWLESKTREFSERMGVLPGQVVVKHFKSRWGSCSKDGFIKYNWRIIMAPHPVVDYLVVHELAHLVHHNHSPEYWKVVESCLPDYRESRTWLKKNGTYLNIDLAPAETIKI